MMLSSRGLPALPNLADHVEALVSMMAACCRLPHPQVVERMGGAVFPSIRDQRNRISVERRDGRVLFLDDNTTPRWAVLWSHGIATSAHPRGWTFAHVWSRSKDPCAYTHLANLLMMPESLASLSDKDGPFAPFLRYHAQQIYGWVPEGTEHLTKPHGFEHIRWNYFENFDSPREFVAERVRDLNNQRVNLLRPLMGLEATT
jgi:hypothetical protein